MSTTAPSWMQFDEDLDQDEVVVADKSYKFYGDTIEIFFDEADHIYYRFNDDGEREDIDGVTTVLGVINRPYLIPWAAKLTIEKLKSLMFLGDGRLKQFSTEELLAWFQEAKKAHKDELSKAGNIGHLAHSALETSIKDAIANNNGVVKACPVVVNDPVHPATDEELTKAQNCVNRAFEWMQSHNVRWLHTERKIYSREYNYSGTLDGDALIDSCGDRFCKGCRGRVFKDRRAITDWKSSNHLSDSYAYQAAAYQLAHLEEFPDLYIPDRWIMRLGKGDDDFEAWYLPDEYFEADFNAFLAALNLHRSLEEIQNRRKVEKQAFSDFVKETKKAEREAAEEAEKQQRAVEREALSTAKKKWDADKKTHYKNLRSNKISVAEAERMTDLAFPPEQRPGFKTEATVTQESVTQTSVAPSKPAPASKSKPADAFVAPGTWVMKL